MHRAGRFAADRVATDLAALVCDQHRLPPERSVYFSSFGLSIFDVAIAARLAQAGERAGIGHRLPLGGFADGRWPALSPPT
jgi:ornithine cyclodeaminase